ncbi:hypothetical protein HDE_04586 [Halotydeus destructor]|nr:hypothetical protein HDE_04586 [Halotydeus destructor]
MDSGSFLAPLKPVASVSSNISGVRLHKFLNGRVNQEIEALEKELGDHRDYKKKYLDLLDELESQKEEIEAVDKLKDIIVELQEQAAKAKTELDKHRANSGPRGQANAFTIEESSANKKQTTTITLLDSDQSSSKHSSSRKRKTDSPDNARRRPSNKHRRRRDSSRSPTRKRECYTKKAIASLAKEFILGESRVDLRDEEDIDEHEGSPPLSKDILEERSEELLEAVTF